MRPYRTFLICTWLMFSCFPAIAQLSSFKSYRVNIFKGDKAKLNIKGNSLAERYRTIIKDTYYEKEYMKKWRGRTGLNFAGHYCFIWWGCGSPCQESTIADLKTGLIYRGPDAALGYKFNPNSRLVIVNPDFVAGDCAFCATEYWVWSELYKEFKKVR